MKGQSFVGSRVIAAIAAAVLLAAVGTAFADAYPSRRITLVVPYTPGSGFDTVARAIGQRFSEAWGQPVIVDNRPGASGTLGTEAVANAPPDGYTLLMTGTPLTVAASLNKASRINPLTDFTPLGNIASSGLALVITGSFPAATLEEFVAQVRARPGHFNYSSPGDDTLQHLGMELFKLQLGLDIVHVPYRGAAAALTDLVSGQVQCTFLPVHSALPHVKNGKLRMLAVAGSKRSPFAPDVPSLAELGYPSVNFELWYGLFGPANLPPAVTQVWGKELATLASSPDMRENLERQGMAPVYWDAQTTRTRVKSEVLRWRDVVEKAGIKPE